MNSDRIRYYNSINKYLKKYYETVGFENCLTNNKYEREHPTFKIGKKIVTDTIIGSGSYGIVFRGHFLTSSSSSLLKKSDLAIKISEVNKENELEIKINREVSNYVIHNRCPHFVIFYSILLCDKKHHSIELFNINTDKYETAAILSNNEYYLTLSELADGVFYDIANYEPRLDIVDNCTIQCLLSIIFFNTLTNKLHDDTHFDNFLFSHINPGGYFHYNIYGVDYYLKNLGFLIMINDFGLVTELNSFNFIKDVIYFAKILNNYDLFEIVNMLNYKIQKSSIKMTLKNKQKTIYSLLFKLLSEAQGFKNQFFTSKPPSSKIINKIPYIIK
jgi:hypothetical protein